MDNIRTTMNRGAFDFLTKPIDFNDLEPRSRRRWNSWPSSGQATKGPGAASLGQE